MEKITITIYKASQGHWLYKEEDGQRVFVSQVLNADDSWKECTDEEKQDWENAQSKIEE